jgi:hypothetical protein
LPIHTTVKKMEDLRDEQIPLLMKALADEVERRMKHKDEHIGEMALLAGQLDELKAENWAEFDREVEQLR